MKKKIEIPKFKSEAEEADWWSANQEVVLDEFERAGKAGELRRGSVAYHMNAASIELANARGSGPGLDRASKGVHPDED